MDKVLFKSYVLQLINGIPQSMYEWAASILCIGVVFLLAWKGWKKGLRLSALLVWVEYVVLIYCSTVICRVTREVRQYDFHPFWSYDRPELVAENIMNVVVFVPVGMVIACSMRSVKLWMVLLLGFGISFSIETLQFFFRRGFSEFDDVFHNTLGCILGYGAYCVAVCVFRGVKRQIA